MAEKKTRNQTEEVKDNAKTEPAEETGKEVPEEAKPETTEEKELRTSITGVTQLIFDFEKLTYITSAGLRVLSVAQKVMNKQGSLLICNPQPDVMEVFEVTGLSEIMDIR